MATEETTNNKPENNKDAAVKPDAETLHTTDPQEHMEGPISSLVKKTGEGLDNQGTADEDEDEKDN